MRRTLAAAVLIVASSLVAAADAQPDPRTLPAVSISDIHYEGAVRLPSSLAWGGQALGMAPDGTLWVACHDYAGGAFARVRVPAIGETATVITPCGPGVPNASGLGDVTNGIRIDGLLDTGSRVVVAGSLAYAFVQHASHWYGTSPASLAGPVRVHPTDNPRLVGGYMGWVPQEWRAAFGGSALTGQCCISIISTTSRGPSAAVFDPATVGSAQTARYLVGYDDDHQTNGRYEEPGGYTGYGMSTSIGGVVFPEGSSSVLFVGTQGTTACYGTGAECHDPTNPDKGTHGYPYFPAVWVYRAADLADVAAGTRQPWDVKQSGIYRLPGAFPVTATRAATWDPAMRRLYVTYAYGDAPEVHVWRIATAGAPPPPPPPPVPLTVTMAVASCAVVAAATPPDASGGWGVQFTLDGTSLGTRDTTAPFTRARTSGVPTGLHTIGGTWTKAGQPPRPIEAVVMECP